MIYSKGDFEMILISVTLREYDNLDHFKMMHIMHIYANTMYVLIQNCISDKQKNICKVCERL